MALPAALIQIRRQIDRLLIQLISFVHDSRIAPLIL